MATSPGDMFVEMGTDVAGTSGRSFSSYPELSSFHDSDGASQVYELIDICSSDVCLNSYHIVEDLMVEPSLSDLDDDLDEDDEVNEGNENDGSEKSGEDVVDSDWIDGIQSVDDAVFEEDSASEENRIIIDHDDDDDEEEEEEEEEDAEDNDSNEELRDDTSNRSDNASEDIHAWHDDLANIETASPTDESYSMRSQESLRSEESLKSQESFNIQSSIPLEDEIAASLSFGPRSDMDLSREMRELFQRSQLVPSFSKGSPPPLRSQEADSLTSDQSDVEAAKRSKKKRRDKTGGDSDTTSDSETSLQANHDDSDSSSSSSSDGTQIWVPLNRQESFKKSRQDTSSCGRRTPQRSDTMQSVHSTTSNPTSSVPRKSGASTASVHTKRLVAKQNHTTGKVDAHIGEEASNGDSGIHTDSPLLSRTSRPPSFQSIENAGRQATPPPSSILKNASETSPRGFTFRDCLFNALSSIYCLAVAVLGIVLPVAEIFADPIPQNLFEGFYIYIYGTSILFLIYVYVFLLQNKTAKSYRRHKRRRCEETKRYGGSSERRKSDGQQFNDRSKRGGSSDKDRHSCYKVGVALGSSHTGSFYLRLGAVVFGIGSMIHDGLKFSAVFDWERLFYCELVLTAVRPLLHLAFTFIQLYFIFLNSKMCIHKYKVLARFGLMHMMATNICDWFSVTVRETLRDILTSQQSVTSRDEISATSSGLLDDSRTMAVEASNLNCTIRNPDMLRRTVELASPYLYPLTAQYSIICTGILYVMWRNIGNPLAKDSAYPVADQKKKGQVIVDCQGSNKGLFFGILVLVGAVVSMIVFYVLIQRKRYTELAVIVIYTSDLVLYTTAIMAAICAFVLMRNLRFQGNRDNNLDESLLMLSTGAVFLYNAFSLLAGIYYRQVSAGTLMIVCACLVLVETSLQTVFIFNGLRRSCVKNASHKCRPGREFVAFLLVCNIALWCMATFERLRLDANPIQYSFYGLVSCTIVDHICIPLIILYRFHSTVCLANIWKSAYKIKQH